MPSKCLVLVPGTGEPPVVMNQHLYGVMLVFLGDPENPERCSYVGEYIALHEEHSEAQSNGLV